MALLVALDLKTNFLKDENSYLSVVVLSCSQSNEFEAILAISIPVTQLRGLESEI